MEEEKRKAALVGYKAGVYKAILQKRNKNSLSYKFGVYEPKFVKREYIHGEKLYIYQWIEKPMISEPEKNIFFLISKILSLPQ